MRGRMRGEGTLETFRNEIVASGTRGMMHMRMDFTIFWMKCTKMAVRTETCDKDGEQ